ncbi:hypothetical protein [Flavobacterium davisii]|nr:hypothetical protein [Flavobacterium davisii]
MSSPDLAVSEQLQQLLSQVEDRTKYFLGYPVSKDFDYSELLPFCNSQ